MEPLLSLYVEDGSQIDIQLSLRRTNATVGGVQFREVSIDRHYTFFSCTAENSLWNLNLASNMLQTARFFILSY
ncbi:hypothetical protein EV1_004544 [Malus domestica]